MFYFHGATAMIRIDMLHKMNENEDGKKDEFHCKTSYIFIGLCWIFRLIRKPFWCDTVYTQHCSHGISKIGYCRVLLLLLTIGPMPFMYFLRIHTYIIIIYDLNKNAIEPRALSGLKILHDARKKKKERVATELRS